MLLKHSKALETKGSVEKNMDEAVNEMIIVTQSLEDSITPTVGPKRRRPKS